MSRRNKRKPTTPRKMNHTNNKAASPKTDVFTICVALANIGITHLAHMYLDKLYNNKGIYAEIKLVSALYVIAFIGYKIAPLFFKKINKHLKK